MQETYRLLRECLWLFEAYEDPAYPPHVLARQRVDLIGQLRHQLTAMEADQQWSSQDDDSLFLVQKLPEGWTPKILEPSRALRFSATSPQFLGHKVHVLAESFPVLSRFVEIYNTVLNHVNTRDTQNSGTGS